MIRAAPFITRLDTSILGRWWWTVDRWTFGAVVVLVSIGALLTLAASPAVAHRIGVSRFYFVYRQAAFIPLAAGLLWLVSLQTHRTVRRIGMIGFLTSLSLMALTPLVGEEVKGATRWINLMGFSLQPSEFIKPTFAVVTAWILAESRARTQAFPGDWVVAALYSGIVILLLMQPDIGMALMVTLLWAVQSFLSGLCFFWVVWLAMGGIASGVGVYFFFSHVRNRVDLFLDPHAGDSYQIAKALQSFRNGGFVGRGPGEGRVKEVLPDAHTDFICAVAGEEFGSLLCFLIIGLFIFIILRGFVQIFKTNSLFTFLSVSGILFHIGLQAVINMASSLRLIPTKGVTLPFISYGGSSLLALSMGMGMVLALTRRPPREGNLP